MRASGERTRNDRTLGVRTGGPGTRDPRLVRYISVTLERLLEDAFDVTWNQISGPDWIAEQKYNISARVPDHATKDDMAGMLRDLLVERLHFAWHVQNKYMPGYELVRGASEPKLEQSEDPAAAPTQANVELTGLRMTSAVFREISTGEFAHWLGAQLGEEMLPVAGGKRLASLPIADKTGLTERYDFAFQYDGSAFLGMVPELAARNLAAIQNSLEKQLGLKLVKGRVEVKNLIIDHAERMPVEN
jgi:uncharacterized protein (TIGR03435 family)